MQNVHARAAMSQAIQKTAGPVGIQFHKLDTVGDRLFRIVAGYSGRQIDQDLAQRFGGKMRMVPGTLTRVDDQNLLPIFRLHATFDGKSMPFTNENIKAHNLISASAGKFVGAATSEIWNVVGQGDEARLVQLGSDDIAAMLEDAKKSRLVTAAQIQVDPTIDYYDYALCIEASTRSLVSGLVVPGETVPLVLRLDGTSAPLDPKLVIESARGWQNEPEITNKDLFIEATTLGSGKTSKVIELLRRYLGFNPKFFAQLERRIREHAGKPVVEHMSPQMRDAVRINL